MPGMSTNEFVKQLQQDVQGICEERHWSVNKESQRGWAFQLWIARLLCDRDRGIDTDPDDAVFTTRDGGIDIILGDPNEKLWYFVQTKYVSLVKKPPIDRKEVVDFFDVQDRMSDPVRFERHFSQAVRDRIGDYHDFLRQGYRAHFYFITTATDVGAKCKDIAQSRSASQEDISFFVLDFSALKELYVETQRLEESIPDRITIDLTRNRWILIEEPRRTLVCVVKANQLINLYKKDGDALFAHNIRTFLGRKSLNKGIIETATRYPKDFFYFNNGISAICTRLDVEGDTATADKFQVINGAQTIGSLAKSKTTSDCLVSLRVTEGESVSTEKGFNAHIIKYNNTQNIVKASDFRSNDDIQLWLEAKFKTLRATKAISKIEYRRKRSGRRVPTGVAALTLEELAKIRFAWLYEPTRCVGDPRSLWTLTDDGGFYERAFGVNGTIEVAWSDKTFVESVVAVAFYKEIERVVEKAKKKDKKFVFLRRLRFFALGLASVYLATKEIDGAHLVTARHGGFREAFDEFWKHAVRELNSLHYDFVTESGGTLFALTRSESKWRSIRSKFTDYLHITEVD